MRAKVSIVVPAYNNADYIEETMRSILAQTYSELEVIVSDHASNDATWELLQQFADDPRVVLLQTPAGGGARVNWNRVTEAATGEFVKLVCGDDLIRHDIVEKQVTAFEPPAWRSSRASRDIIDANRPVVVHNRGIGRLRGRHPGAGPSARPCGPEPTFRRAGLRDDAARDAGRRVLGRGRAYLIDEASYVNVLSEATSSGSASRSRHSA